MRCRDQWAGLDCSFSLPSLDDDLITSRWEGHTASTAVGIAAPGQKQLEFEELHSKLDELSQKTKALHEASRERDGSRRASVEVETTGPVDEIQNIARHWREEVSRWQEEEEANDWEFEKARHWKSRLDATQDAVQQSKSWQAHQQVRQAVLKARSHASQLPGNQFS